MIVKADGLMFCIGNLLTSETASCRQMTTPSADGLKTGV